MGDYEWMGAALEEARKAAELGIPVIDEAAFFEMIHKNQE